MKKYKPYLVTAVVAIIAVGIYVKFIKPNLPVAISAYLP